MPTSGTTAPPSPSAGERIRTLNPGWFASVMGTGILAVATYTNPGSLTSLARPAHVVGVVLAVLAVVLAVVLLGAAAHRWIRYGDAAWADFSHPMRGGMHATLPGALLVLAVTTATVGPGLLPIGVVTGIVAGLAVVGGLLAFVVGVIFGYSLVVGDHPGPAVNGGWFIPPVVAAIVPMALAPLIPRVDPETGRTLLGIGYTFFGIGFILFLLTVGLLHDRLILHPLPAAPMAPTLWIGLGPIAVSALAPMTLARAGAGTWGADAHLVTLITQIVSTTIWGFGLWWLAMVVALLVRYARTGGVPFHLGWWAFVFPLGAYVVATLSLARAWQSSSLEGLGVLFYVGLVGFWAVVTVRTSTATRSGRIWAS